MKSKLLYLLLWAVIPVFSQGKLPYTTPKEIEINTAFATQINSVFVNLDNSRIPNGLLQDFAMEYTSLDAYSGSLSDSTFVHPGVLKQLYSTLLMSRVNSNTSQGFVSYSNFENNWNNARDVNTITLSGLYFKYSKFIDNAYPNKITISNNKLYDKYVNGVWQNPYEEKKVFAISPSIISYKGLDFKVKFPSNLWYTNNSSSVQSVKINFNDGNGYVDVNPGQQVSINYNSSGIKTWTYKISLSTGETLLSHSKMNFEDVPNHCTYGTSGGGQCIETLEITSTKTYQGSSGKATLQINYGNVYGEIRKPLIVAEGLDLGAITTPEFPFGESSLVDFLRKSFNSESGNLIGLLNGSEDFFDHDQEYDIIYINWNDGTDFIQRNAYALEEVIKWVNEHKTTTAEENVIIGQSMGGLVARFALKEMEDAETSHDTRLFVSQDSPHLGANLPLGYQYAARNGRNQYIKSPFQLLGGDVILPLFNNGVGVSDYLGILDEPAVKQMLIQWVDRDYTIDNTVHDAWQTTLKSMGYPQNTKNVAISNGSQCAITQGFSPGSTLFDVDGRV